MNSPEKKLKELTDSIERYERSSRKRAIIYSLVIPVILLTLYLGTGVWLVAKLESKKIDLENKNKKLDKQIQDQTTKIKNLTVYSKELETRISKLEPRIQNLLPSSMTIYLAMKSQEQEDVAQRIKDKYIEMGVPHEKIRIVSNRRGNPPYATEVRYFNAPQDIELAQSIVFGLQRNYNIIFSRISLVDDQRPIGTIEIHFNKSF